MKENSMHKYTLEEIQHMAAIQTPLPAAYYDATEVDAERSVKTSRVGEQDKRAEEWSEDKDPEDFRSLSKNMRSEGQTSRADAVDFLIEKAKQKKADAAALAQARREGEEKMYTALAECVHSLRRMRRGTKAELLKLLDSLYAPWRRRRREGNERMEGVMEMH